MLSLCPSCGHDDADLRRTLQVSALHDWHLERISALWLADQMPMARALTAEQLSSTSRSAVAQVLELSLQALAQAVLNEGAQIQHQLVIGPVDQAHPITLAAHQPGSQQLAQLPADV